MFTFQSILVAIDIGNTNVHLGAFQHGVAAWQPTPLLYHKTVRTEEMNLEEIPIKSYLPMISEILIASVNPKAEEAICKWLEEDYPRKPLKLQEDIKIPLPTLVKEPDKVGVDRLLNALAAYDKTKGATIVVDMGTAVTVDAVSEKGEFLGGVIAPGLESSAKALHLRTALLPEITPTRPYRYIGQDTQEALTSGLYWGTVGMVRNLIDGVKKEMTRHIAEPGAKGPKVIATGGDSEFFASDVDLFHEVIPTLTLEGMVLAYKTWVASK